MVIGNFAFFWEMSVTHMVCLTSVDNLGNNFQFENHPCVFPLINSNARVQALEKWSFESTVQTGTNEGLLRFLRTERPLWYKK